MTGPALWQRRTGICLNMIVKNETPVLERLFRSVAGVIDYYVIVDTGSDDGTPEFIAQWMAQAGIPGEVHRRAWVNFGVNREQALQLAVQAGKADWLLLIDADEELGCSKPDFYRQLVPGVTYRLEKRLGAVRYLVPHLLDIRHNQWRWRAPVHEYLEHLAGPDLRQELPDVWITCHAGEGARSRGKSAADKFLADAQVLERHLAEQPDDHRSRFYLAQSYRDAGHWALAREHYLRRVAMQGGWIEETFFAQYQAGAMARLLNLPHETVRADLLAACNLRPCRGEALHELAVHCRHHGLWGEACAFASAGASLPKPKDNLFVQYQIYEWRLLDEQCVAAYWADLPAMARDAALEILRRHAHEGVVIAEADLDRVRANLRFAEEKLSRAGG